MPSSKGQTNHARRLLWLALAIAAVIAAYTGIWFHMARQLEARTVATLASLAGSGATAECEKPAARGYPFRLGLFCDSANYRDGDGRLAVKASVLRSAAQIYDPRQIVGELGIVEATFAANPAAGVVDMHSEDVRFSARLDSSFPERASLEGSNLSFANGVDIAKARSAQLHMRQNGSDLDLAFRFTGLDLLPALLEGRSVTLPEGNGVFTLTDGMALTARQTPHSLRGQSGIVRGLEISTGEQSGLAVSGPISVDEDGLIDAELRIAVTNPEEVGRFLGGIFPENNRQIAQAMAGLTLLGDSPSLPLNITKGKAQIAFVRLGTLPPVD
ncbi:DUF2125 domain-containing protein [Mesorhizobium xinjiangense]|uniref:DUF2125 domain-containing protein n=1 Tax=Mesorhizobium xinjiangense TaxID=2678685 RepID=UPI0018DCF269|nr:DUF2125 domain-containing protein [Mesorhizobium xinjiangense]